MRTWNEIYDEVAEIVSEFGGEGLLFRGHGDLSWSLAPGLARYGWNAEEMESAEDEVYFGFVTSAGSLLRDVDEAWDVLFVMQHHGVPTRLLDWSTRFGVALHFALSSGSGDAAVWILDPYELNAATLGSDRLIRASDLVGTYSSIFIKKTSVFSSPVVAVMPPRDQPRLFSQHAAFTLHGDLTKPLDELYPSTVRKIIIPTSARGDAEVFLRVAGISEFTIFPDLDGLGRELRRQTFPPDS